MIKGHKKKPKLPTNYKRAKPALNTVSQLRGVITEAMDESIAASGFSAYWYFAKRSGKLCSCLMGNNLRAIKAREPLGSDGKMLKSVMREILAARMDNNKDFTSDEEISRPLNAPKNIHSYGHGHNPQERQEDIEPEPMEPETTNIQDTPDIEPIEPETPVMGLYSSDSANCYVCCGKDYIGGFDVHNGERFVISASDIKMSPDHSDSVPQESYKLESAEVNVDDSPWFVRPVDETGSLYFNILLPISEAVSFRVMYNNIELVKGRDCDFYYESAIVDGQTSPTYPDNTGLVEEIDDLQNVIDDYISADENVYRTFRLDFNKQFTHIEFQFSQGGLLKVDRTPANITDEQYNLNEINNISLSIPSEGRMCSTGDVFILASQRPDQEYLKDILWTVTSVDRTETHDGILSVSVNAEKVQKNEPYDLPMWPY